MIPLLLLLPLPELLRDTPFTQVLFREREIPSHNLNLCAVRL
jgi:hypothetical protein